MAGPTRDGPDGPEEPLGDDDVAARWAEITEQLGDLQVPAPEPSRPEGPRPDEPPAEEPRPEEPRADGGPPLPLAPHRPAGRPAPGPRDYVADEEEGFVQPDPGPISPADPVVVLGWAAVAGAVVALVILPMAWGPLPGAVLTGVLAVLAAGAGLLLWRMPRSRDGGPTDRGGGAVV